jgi:transposase
MGLDLSDRRSHYHVLRGDGVTLDRGVVANTREELSKLFDAWKGCRLVLEVGCQSAWISRLAQHCGMHVLVANPRRVELISKSDRKNDRSDAQLLAELGRSSPTLLSAITHRSEETQADLMTHRARKAAVNTRTALINAVRGMLKTSGVRAPGCSPECFGRRVRAAIPAQLRSALESLIKLIDATNREIKQYDKELERLGRERYPVTAQMRQVDSVGPVLSLCYVLTIEEPRRFKRSRHVGSYVGAVPRQRSSGNLDPQLHITKTGDSELRRLLVLAATRILGPHGKDCDLRRFGLKIAGTGNDKRAKKRARVAVARKLAVLLHRLWSTGEVYDPFHNAKRRGESVPA